MDSSAGPEMGTFRSGIVALVGRANAGKSTLLNALVGTKVSIVTRKPQTTRHTIHGVVHRPEGQIVFMDTPGFFQTHRNELVDRLHARTRKAMGEVDAFVHVVDPTRVFGPEDQLALEALSGQTRPRVLCLNKSDVARRPALEEWRARESAYQATVEVSALTGHNLENLIKAVLPLLPVGPPLYPEGEITNANRDFRIAELIREKIYLLTEEEVPYRTAVRVDEVIEEPDESGNQRLVVRASILVAEERYKSMLIGARGQMIRRIRLAAQRDLQVLVACKVALELTVRVQRTTSGW
jgi:GTP-binding protein Era